jgi:hypothetical protein
VLGDEPKGEDVQPSRERIAPPQGASTLPRNGAAIRSQICEQ